MEENIKNCILTISGEPASGKSTVIKELIKIYKEQGYNVHLYSVGDFFREMAQERQLSIAEFNEYVKKREDIDRLIDNKVKEYGKRINSKKRPNDVYIFDSRLAWYNIDNSFSIRLTVDNVIAGKRVFNDSTRGNEDKYNTLEEAIRDTEERKKGEIERYKERYGIDLENPNNYKMLMDTSNCTVKEIASQIIEKERQYRSPLELDSNEER